MARQGIVIKDHTKNGFLAGTTLRFMDSGRQCGMALRCLTIIGLGSSGMPRSSRWA